jgi:hypothetical protein
MIYGHQFDRGWSTREVCVGAAVAAVVGAGIGLLFAPQRGTDARRSLGNAASRLRMRLEAGRQSPVRKPVPAPVRHSTPELAQQDV